jgi:hypothetical protein
VVLTRLGVNTPTSSTKCSWPLEKILILSFGLISPSQC